MASLKDLKNRISSVQGTRRLTSAMKMVSGAKLRKATNAAEAARPYAERMERMLGSLAAGAQDGNGPALLAGTGKDNVQLFVIVTSDRGLCGGFNGNLVREAQIHMRKLLEDGREIKILIVGRKGVSLLRREFGNNIVQTFEEISKPAPSFDGASLVVNKISSMFDAGEFDVCTIYYNKFVNALTQEATPLQLIPFIAGNNDGNDNKDGASALDAQYEYEPEEEAILAALLPKNLSVQLFRAMLESFASEQAARMTAMDNATRNAGDMIDKLTITFNRSRQAQITSELIEIISGAEAL